jgi:hypothetical protein
MQKFSLILAGFSTLLSIFAWTYVNSATQHAVAARDRSRCLLIHLQREVLIKALPSPTNRDEMDILITAVRKEVPGIVRDGKDVCDY